MAITYFRGAAVTAFPASPDMEQAEGWDAGIAGKWPQASPDGDLRFCTLQRPLLRCRPSHDRGEHVDPAGIDSGLVRHRRTASPSCRRRPAPNRRHSRDAFRGGHGHNRRASRNPRRFQFQSGGRLILIACFLYAGYTLALRNRPAMPILALIALLAFLAFLSSPPMRSPTARCNGRRRKAGRSLPSS